MDSSELAEMVPTWTIAFLSVQALEMDVSSATAVASIVPAQEHCRLRCQCTDTKLGTDEAHQDYRMSTPHPDKSPALNIRIKAPQRALIARAARRANKTISDFVRDAAIHEAEDILLDVAHFELDPAAWAELIAALDAPPADNPRLRDLLSRKAPWET